MSDQTMREALQQALMALTGYLPAHRNGVTDKAIASAREALAAPAQRAFDSDAVLKAAINCPHTIESAMITLEFDARKPGHNALNQLHARLREALNAAPAQSEAKADPLRAAVESMVGMLENREWAEHASTFKAPGDDLASRLEACITDLLSDLSEHAGTAEDAPAVVGEAKALAWPDFLKLANEAYGQAVDHDFGGNAITDYDVILTGAYGPAVKRLMELAVVRLAPPVDAPAGVGEAKRKVIDNDIRGNPIYDPIDTLVRSAVLPIPGINAAPPVSAAAEMGDAEMAQMAFNDFGIVADDDEIVRFARALLARSKP